MKLLSKMLLVLCVLTLISCVPETNKKCKDYQISVNGSCASKEPQIVVLPTPTIAPVPTPALIPTVQPKLSCGSIPHNGTESRVAYSACSVPYGQSCSTIQQSQTRTCNNGTWSAWSGSFTNLTCSVAAASSCGNTPNNGTESRIAYSASSVPYGQSCSTIQQSQTRTCNNGTWSAWSGTFTNLTCSVAAASSCGNIASGEGDTRVRYQTATAPLGSTCVSEIQTALCINGQLGNWSGTYTYSQCINTKNYPLEIIQPQPGLTVKNRFYKAYPGLEYNVRAGVIGGIFPYTYELTKFPAGMNIDSLKGIIVWPNPIISTTPYSVTLKVTDSEGAIQTVSWTITVTTSGFIFIDPVKGNHATTTACTGVDGANSLPAGKIGTGTGTLNNPFLTISDMYRGSCYNAKWSSTYAGYFVYFKGGTYYVDAFLSSFGDEENQNIAFSTNVKPLVWLAYPGETPVIDFEGAYTHIFFEENNPNTIYIDGLSVTNGTGKTFTAPSAATPVFRRIKGYNHGAVTTAHYNQSYILLSRSSHGSNVVIQDCELNTLDHGAAIKIYDTNKALIEDNVIHDIIDTTTKGSSIEGIALKVDATNITVRGNQIYNVSQSPIGGDMTGEDVPCGNFEIDHNFIQNPSGDAIFINRDPDTVFGKGPVKSIYLHHNTFVGRIDLNNSSALSGPYYINNNVLIQSAGNYVNQISPKDISKTYIFNNLTKSTTVGVIDSDGHLIPEYSDMGLMGW